MRAFQVFIRIIAIIFVSLYVAAAATPAATTTDTLLTGIATAAKAVGALRNDPQSRMFNYVKYHFSAAATRLSSVCNMMTLTYSGAASDGGAIVGLANNTKTTFMVMQGNSIIGQVLPGWNSDIILNLSVLSDTTTSPLLSFSFVPTTGSQQSQLLVRVMTGLQLFTHIANIEKRESGKAAINWYKNGNNPLPGAGDRAAVSSDLYLVVENETLTSGTPLPAAAKRVQVLNLSNLTDLYTVSLAISNMGLAQINNQVTSQQQLESVYAISIQGVHVLDEVQGHTIPLLLMPRAVYQAGSGVNSSYASYVQAYANTMSKAYAGIAPVYYDLFIAYPHEPFMYLKTLKYLDMQASLYAVVDQNAVLPSGQIIGSMILTDVYGAYAQDVSPDISWVACTQSGLDTTDDVHILFSFVNSDSVVASSTSSAPTNTQPGQFALPSKFNGLGGIFAGLKAALQAKMQGQLQQQAAVSQPDQQSPSAYAGFPMTNISAALMEFNGYFHAHVQTASGMHWSGPILDWYHSYLYDGNPTQFTAGQSYNTTGSFPSAWYNLTDAQWKAGIKMVPVFYDTKKCVPYSSMEDFNRISSSNQSSLYFYSFDGVTGQPIGVVPAYNGGNSMVPATFPVSTSFINLSRNGTFNGSTQQASDYATGGTAVPGQSGLVGVSQCDIEFPGYAYFAKHPRSNNLMAVRSKLPNISSLNEIVQQAWMTQNAFAGSWLMAIPIADAQANIIVEVTGLGSNVYQIVLFDTNNNVLGFQQIYVQDGANKFVAGHISSLGDMKSFTHEMPITTQKSYFKLIDTAASGIVMVPTIAPAALMPVVSSPTKTTIPSTSTVASKTTRTSSKTDVTCQAENKKLKEQNAVLKRKVKYLEEALSQG